MRVHLIGILAAALAQAVSHAQAPLPDPLTAEWNGERVCELLSEDAVQRILRCTFPPSVGHERHYHNRHFGYVIAGGRLRITDANGTREADYTAGSSGVNDPIEWHEALNVGDSTAVFLVVEEKAPETIDLLRLTPDDIDWGDDAAETVRRPLVGDRTAQGMYAYRVRFPEGTRIEPHYHPENRIVTVVEGTLHMGFGEDFDASAMRALPAGSLWTEPGGQAHYVWARSGPVVIQIIGYGPTATIQVNQGSQ